jgi:apolipoprotein N-acyltransferase
VSLALNVALAALTVTALALSVLGALAWRRSGRTKMGVLAVGFGWFALAGLLASWWLFARENLETLLTLHTALSAAGLLTN